MKVLLRRVADLKWDGATQMFYSEDQPRDDHGRFAEAQTPGATTKTRGDTFEITTPTGASVSGYLKNQDFPNEGTVPDRGEIFLASVPESQQHKGVGYSLSKDALRLIASHGSKTVNLHPTHPGGKAIVKRLIKDGHIGEAIRTSATGKAEHPILSPTIAKNNSGQQKETDVKQT